MPASGYYCNLTDLENEYGAANILAWSDVNSAGSLNYTSIQSALDYADSEINNHFAFGPYTVPLTQGGASDATIRYWGTVIAGVRLYTARGQLDTVQNADGSTRLVNKYIGQLNGVYKQIADCKRGVVRLDCQRKWPVASSPSGVSV